MTNEPVSLQAAIAGAINVTLGLLSILGVSNEVVGALQIAAAAWIVVVFAFIVRARVTPNQNVALTVKQKDALVAAGYQPGNQVP